MKNPYENCRRQVIEVLENMGDLEEEVKGLTDEELKSKIKQLSRQIKNWKDQIYDLEDKIEMADEKLQILVDEFLERNCGNCPKAPQSLMKCKKEGCETAEFYIKYYAHV